MADQGKKEGHWESHSDGEGNVYYYHTVRGETTWQMPEGFVEPDAKGDEDDADEIPMSSDGRDSKEATPPADSATAVASSRSVATSGAPVHDSTSGFHLPNIIGVDPSGTAIHGRGGASRAPANARPHPRPNIIGFDPSGTAIHGRGGASRAPANARPHPRPNIIGFDPSGTAIYGRGGTSRARSSIPLVPGFGANGRPHPRPDTSHLNNYSFF